MGALNDPQREYGREVSLDLVDKGFDVGVPDAYFVVEASAEQQNHALVEGQAEDAPGVTPIGELPLGVDGVPQQ